MFKNLDELVLCLNGATLDSLCETLQNASTAADSPRNALISLGQHYIRTAFDRKGRWLMIFEHRLPAGEPLPDWFQAKVERNFSLVESQLARLAPHRSPDAWRLAARTLWGGLHGICLLALQGKLAVAGVATPEMTAACLVGKFLAGFLAEE